MKRKDVRSALYIHSKYHRRVLSIRGNEEAALIPWRGAGYGAGVLEAGEARVGVGAGD